MTRIMSRASHTEDGSLSTTLLPSRLPRAHTADDGDELDFLGDGEDTDGGQASLLSSPSRPLHSAGDLRRNGSLQRMTAAAKDGLPLDWHTEGPGRRVGYEDLTAIDWIFEYTKERQRQRILASNAVGLMGYARRFLDASQVWIVLILTGLLVGAVAAAIDITTDWLADLKLGFCSSGPEGGQFYLNKSFCCYGYDQGSKCVGWKPWSEALGIHSTVGKWFIEYLFFVLSSVTLAYCAALLVQEYAIYAMHSGIPELKTVLGGFVMRNFLGTWTLVTKSLGLVRFPSLFSFAEARADGTEPQVLAVGSGMWLGKEGPLVHVACCCANLFIKLFDNIRDNEGEKTRKAWMMGTERLTLNSSEARSAFGGGGGRNLRRFRLPHRRRLIQSRGESRLSSSPSVRSMAFDGNERQQLSYYFPDKTMWQSFVCAMTAAVVLQAFDPFRSGNLVLYQTKYSTDWHGFEIVPYAFLGVLGGIYGGLFIKANMAVARWKKARPRFCGGPLGQVLAMALLTAVINYPNLFMKVQSSELVSNLFADCSQVLDDQIGVCKTGAASAGTTVLLVLAALLGSGLATATFGLQIPAGIILPSMAIGALTGRAAGIVMEMWVANHPAFILFSSCSPDAACITPGTYAIIGAAAALAGVTRMTVSIVVIMFELTGALTYVLPIMVAVMTSKWVGDAISSRGIYESWIHLKEYPFLDNSDETAIIPDVPASHVMTRIEDLIVLTAKGHTMASLNSILEMHPYHGFPVISDPTDAILLGYISRAELRYNVTTASRPPRSLPPESRVYFCSSSSSSSSSSTNPSSSSSPSKLDLRPWMDQTPLTLPSRTSLHLVVSYFQKLGLRYVLLSDRGALQGLLTKKDVWYVLNGAGAGDESPRAAVVGQRPEHRALLGEEGVVSAAAAAAAADGVALADDDGGSIL
ncbi:hypothetical protein L249_7957 [Ophiocordyceps polyrhachis-furcata BCC 54312]|uniref:Chloride channel protein n=1 Tax=Ophiocordyceps polyrhachis-furcata BCC 54312 TaxID=1330021 RepID=A0A367LH21_9HYPO|nr:hypothetical protein L249_7957 [Ophiocordyceps polyrhachis-furcata BCC 54312]